MKGIIFNILEKFVVEKFGEETYEDLLDSCKLETTEPYISAGTYPDKDLLQMVVKASELLQIAVPDILKAFGRYAFGQLTSHMPVLISPYKSAKDFLKDLEEVIHVEVKKLHPEAYLPSFEYEDLGENELVMKYFSKRKLDDLAEGLIIGACDHFNEKCEIKRKSIVVNGKEGCAFHLTFNSINTPNE